MHLQQSLFCMGKSESLESQSNGVTGSTNGACVNADKEIIVGSTRLVSTTVFTLLLESSILFSIMVAISIIYLLLTFYHLWINKLCSIVNNNKFTFIHSFNLNFIIFLTNDNSIQGFQYLSMLKTVLDELEWARHHVLSAWIYDLTSWVSTPLNWVRFHITSRKTSFRITLILFYFYGISHKFIK